MMRWVLRRPWKLAWSFVMFEVARHCQEYATRSVVWIDLLGKLRPYDTFPLCLRIRRINTYEIEATHRLSLIIERGRVEDSNWDKRFWILRSSKKPHRCYSIYLDWWRNGVGDTRPFRYVGLTDCTEVRLRNHSRVGLQWFCGNEWRWLGFLWIIGDAAQQRSATMLAWLFGILGFGDLNKKSTCHPHEYLGLRISMANASFGEMDFFSCMSTPNASVL